MEAAMKVLMIILASLVANIANADSLSLDVLGLTHHGVEVYTTNEVVRRVSNDGNVVWNPEINVTYQKESRLYNLSVISDCFDNTAMFAGGGKSWEVIEDLNVALVFGLYIRKHPPRIVMPTFTSVGDYDVLPLPWLSVRKEIRIDKVWSASVGLSSNYALTHGTFGLTYQLQD
jgi:hypothetical protein